MLWIYVPSRCPMWRHVFVRYVRFHRQENVVSEPPRPKKPNTFTNSSKWLSMIRLLSTHILQCLSFPTDDKTQPVPIFCQFACSAIPFIFTQCQKTVTVVLRASTVTWSGINEITRFLKKICYAHSGYVQVTKTSPIKAQWPHYEHPQILRSTHTMYLCVLYVSQNKQLLFPYTALTGWFL
jgi:hypothetical protein